MTFSTILARVGRKRLLLCLLVAGCILAAFGWHEGTKKSLRNALHEHDPATLALEPGFNTYVRRAFLEDGAEIGIITMKDGSSSQYCFQSHHIARDQISRTLFVISDGKEIFMEGCFCCEVQLPEAQLGSLSELRYFIQHNDGIAP